MTGVSLKGYCYFASLPEAALATVASRLEPHRFPAGAEIIREGAAGDYFYFLAAGEAVVTRRTARGQEAIVARLRGGDAFGEMALLTDTARAATVTAATEVRVLRLAKADFERVLIDDACLSHRFEQRAEDFDQFDRVKVLEPFARLEPEEAVALAARMRVLSFPAERDIVAQGERGDRFYVVKSGSVAVIKQPPEGRAAVVAVLGEGESFGEEALLTGSARSATVRTIEPTEVWALEKEDFADVLRANYLRECSAEELLGRAADDARVLLDVRTPGEFAEEYIPTAVNLPLDQLRQRYAELDPAKSYVAVCLSGARSAVAAFLLSMHGLRAVNLAGGLLRWPGPLAAGSEAGVHKPHASG